MSFKHVLELYESLDTPDASGNIVKKYLEDINNNEMISVETITDNIGTTDFIKITIKGKNGKLSDGNAPTLGIVGRLGGIGARPERVGFVSDGDGALVAVSAAAKLLDMNKKGDILNGDVILTTHICPKAPTQPHEPVPFMGSPVEIETMNQYEVTNEMDAILSVDTTKGNNIVNHKGFAITPTVKEGYILRVSPDLLFLYEQVTGILPVTLPITMQDITPYGNDIYHINSILQPAVATDKPVVGVAITTESPVAGCATGASHLIDIETTVRYVIEVAKYYGEDKCDIYDKEEFEKINKLYGDMSILQTK